jgi:2-hydroxychromene-2-carboxylate isomerase
MSSERGKEVDFYFDVVCPFAYLAHTQVERVCKEAGATVRWVPILLGGLFREIGAGDGPMPGMPEAKARLNTLDMKRWAEHWDAPLTIPEGHPRRTVLAMRTIIASGDVPRAAAALFRRYWRDGLDVSDESIVRDALDAEGFVGSDLVAAASKPEIKQALRDNTNEAKEAGAFGVPTFVVHPDDGKSALIWGQDRMHFIAPALRGELLTEVPT